MAQQAVSQAASRARHTPARCRTVSKAGGNARERAGRPRASSHGISSRAESSRTPLPPPALPPPALPTMMNLAPSRPTLPLALAPAPGPGARRTLQWWRRLRRCGSGGRPKASTPQRMWPTATPPPPPPKGLPPRTPTLTPIKPTPPSPGAHPMLLLWGRRRGSGGRPRASNRPRMPSCWRCCRLSGCGSLPRGSGTAS